MTDRQLLVRGLCFQLDAELPEPECPPVSVHSRYSSAVGPLLDVFWGVSVVGAWLVVLGGLYLNESYLTVFTEATKVLQVI